MDLDFVVHSINRICLKAAFETWKVQVMPINRESSPEKMDIFNVPKVICKWRMEYPRKESRTYLFVLLRALFSLMSKGSIV